MSGSGSAPDNRTLAQITIESSWNVDANGNAISGTNSEIWNAVVGYHDQNVNLNGATEMWNNATSGGNHAPYYFQVNQSFFLTRTSTFPEKITRQEEVALTLHGTQLAATGRCA